MSIDSKHLVGCSIYFLIGVYMIIKGAVSKTLLNEVEAFVTEDDRARAKATPAGRLLIILVGIACIVYSLFCLRGSL